MGRQIPEGFLTIDGVVERLNISKRHIQKMISAGRLRPHITAKQRTHLFKIEDVDALALARAEGETNLWVIHNTALQALATARRAEEGLRELQAQFGISLIVLERDPAAVRALYEEAAEAFSDEDVADPEFVSRWGGIFAAMDEVYLELVARLVGTDEPWLLFIEHAEALASAVQQLNPATVGIRERHLLLAGKKHLLHISYLLCRRLHGTRVTRRAFDKYAGPVEMLLSILHPTLSP